MGKADPTLDRAFFTDSPEQDGLGSFHGSPQAKIEEQIHKRFQMHQNKSSSSSIKAKSSWCPALALILCGFLVFLIGRSWTNQPRGRISADLLREQLQGLDKEISELDKRKLALQKDRELLVDQLSRLRSRLTQKRPPSYLGWLRRGGEVKGGFGARGSSGDGCPTEEERQAGKGVVVNGEGGGRGCERRPVLENRMQPRVYVYELPSIFNRELARRFSRCSTDQYGTEVFFHEAFLQSEVRTHDPDEADFFFVPIYGECFLWSWEMLKGEKRTKSFAITNEFYTEALNILQHQMPYWNRTDGRDHIFSFPGARGPTIFNDWKSRIPHSIFLTPEGDRKAFYFNTWKDIVIPGMESDENFYLPRVRSALPREKQHLAFFRGTIDHREGRSYSRGIRPRLKQVFANETDVIFGPMVPECDRECYHREMALSHFCICPLGWTPWTLRFYQALMTRCIPVVVADDIEFPWENEIDFTKFAIKVPESEVEGLLEIMRSMPEEERERRRQEIDKVWLAFSYQRPPQHGDAFHMLMRELARKVRRFKTSNSHAWA